MPRSPKELERRTARIAAAVRQLVPWAYVETATLGHPFVYVCLDNRPREGATYVVWDGPRGARVWTHDEPMRLGTTVDGKPKFMNRRRLIHSEALGKGGGADYVGRVARRLAQLAEEHVRHAAPAAEGEAA